MINIPKRNARVCVNVSFHLGTNAFQDEFKKYKIILAISPKLPPALMHENARVTDLSLVNEGHARSLPYPTLC